MKRLPQHLNIASSKTAELKWDGILCLIYSIMYMGIFPCLVVIFIKGNKFYDFLFVSLDNIILPHRTFTVKNLLKS